MCIVDYSNVSGCYYNYMKVRSRGIIFTLFHFTSVFNFIFVIALLFVAPFSSVSAQTQTTTPPPLISTPTCTIIVTPRTITVGGSVQVRWTSTYTTSGTITRIGNVATDGAVNLLPTSAALTVFTGTFVGPGGTATCSASVTVTTEGGTGAGGGTYSTGEGYEIGGTNTPMQTYGPGDTYAPTPYSINPSNFATNPKSNPFSPTQQKVTSGSNSNGGGTFGSLVPCGGGVAGSSDPENKEEYRTYLDNATSCNICSLGLLTQRVINFMLMVAIPLSAALFAYAGILYFTSATNPTKVKDAKKIFSNVFIGFIIALSGYLIVQTTLNAFLSDTFKTGNWKVNTLECEGEKRERHSNIGQIFTGLFKPSAGTATLVEGGLSDAQIKAGINAATELAPKFNAACQGDSSCTNAMRALCVVESGCNKNVMGCNDSGACGMMQIKPDTACGTDGTIPGCSGGRATDPAQVKSYLSNTDNSIGLSTKIYKALVNTCNGDTVCASAGYNGGPGALIPSACCASGPAYACNFDCGTTKSNSFQCDVNPTNVCVLNTGYKQTRDYIIKVQKQTGFSNSLENAQFAQ